MCASNRWRFSSKSAMIPWVREEREMRLCAYITFCAAEEMKDETRYYKEQNLNWKINELKSNNMDIVRIANNKNKITKSKYDRYCNLKEQLSNILIIASNAHENIMTRVRETEKHADSESYKEMTLYWINMAKIARKSMESCEELYKKLTDNVKFTKEMS